MNILKAKNTRLLILTLAMMSFAMASRANPHESCYWCHPAVPSIAQASQGGSFSPSAAISENSITSLCLGCHDGTVSSSIAVHVASRFETSANHPTGVDYGFTAASRGELHDPWSLSGLGSTIEDDLLVNGRVECTSCHDVHGSDRPALLPMSNAGSRLCLTCHDK